MVATVVSGAGGPRNPALIDRRERRDQSMTLTHPMVPSKEMHYAQIASNLNGRRVCEVAAFRDFPQPYFVRKALK